MSGPCSCQTHYVFTAHGTKQSVQCFGAFTADLYALAEWLRQCQIETVVMESIGVDQRAHLNLSHT